MFCVCLPFVCALLSCLHCYHLFLCASFMFSCFVSIMFFCLFVSVSVSCFVFCVCLPQAQFGMMSNPSAGIPVAPGPCSSEFHASVPEAVSCRVPAPPPVPPFPASYEPTDSHADTPVDQCLLRECTLCNKCGILADFCSCNHSADANVNNLFATFGQ